MSRILILGATSDVGGEIARLFAARNDMLFLVARNSDRLRQFAGDLGSQVAGTASYDFVDTNRAASVVSEAVETMGGLDLALIVHGYLGDQIASESNVEEATRIFRVNCESAVAQLIALGNYFESTKGGQLAVISSVAGERGRPRNYTYGAAKQALTIYLQGLRSRLYPHTTVTTIKLGPVDTKMTTDHAKNASFVSKEKAAQGIVRAIDTKRSEVYVPGYWAPIMGIVTRLPEALFQRLRFLSAR